MQEAVARRLYEPMRDSTKIESIEKMTLGQILKKVTLRDYFIELDRGYSEGFTPIVYKGLELRYKIGVAYIKDQIAVVELPITYKSGHKDYLAFDVTLNGIYQFSKKVADIDEDWTLENCFDVMLRYIPTQL